MKTATITWITYNNYGTELQAFALQNYIKSLKIENDIISDQDIIREIYEQRRQNNSVGINVESEEGNSGRKNSGLKRKIKNKLASHNGIVNVYRLIRYGRPKEKIYEKSRDGIEHFKARKLRIVYGIKKDDMRLLNDVYDIFLCGSDQIWSLLNYNYNEYYFLDFAKKKKISYATSIGSRVIDEVKGERVKKLLKDFSYLSVREKETAAQLSKILNRNVEWVCDPTLLYDRDFWSSFSQKPKRKRKYILCYFLEDKKWYFEYAKACSKYYNAEILLIPNLTEFCHYEGIYKKEVNPEVFVGLFEEAFFVLTDSYHGSIFSIIFNKQFLYLKRFSENNPISQNIRIESLFGYLNIENVIVQEKIFEDEDVKLIDYEKVNILIEKHRNDSQCFIKRGLTGKNDYE